MNRSHIISNKSTPGCLPHCDINQGFKLNVESPSIPEKSIELFYCLIARPLFISKITRLDIQVGITYILTKMKLLTNYHKDRHLESRYIFCEEDRIIFTVTYKILMYVF